MEAFLALMKWFGELLALILSGSPLIILILGMVQFMKAMGLAGKGVMIASLITGLIVGGGAMLSVSVPTTFADWFKLAIGSIMWGLGACGVFDAIKAATMKGVEKAITAAKLQDD